MNLRQRASLAALVGMATLAHAGGPFFYNGHYYNAIVDGGTMTWNQARAAAAASTYNDGSTDYFGYLAVITDQAENDAVRGFFATAGLYIGGEHLGGAAGNYGWINGETWNAFSAGHWAGGEPNGDSGGMQYTWTGEDGWNDLLKDTVYGSQAPGYIVEYEAVPEPATMIALALGATALIRRRKA